jgi:hypothetical protein
MAWTEPVSRKADPNKLELAFTTQREIVSERPQSKYGTTTENAGHGFFVSRIVGGFEASAHNCIGELSLLPEASNKL